jgi:hypothetical protein
MSRLSAALMFAVLVFAAAPAGADVSHPAGAIDLLRVHNTGTTENIGGILVIAYPNGGRFFWYWGGTACPNTDLTTAQIEMLTQALVHQRSVVTLTATDSSHCLTGVEVH